MISLDTFRWLYSLFWVSKGSIRWENLNSYGFCLQVCLKKKIWFCFYFLIQLIFLSDFKVIWWFKVVFIMCFLSKMGWKMGFHPQNPTPIITSHYNGGWILSSNRQYVALHCFFFFNWDGLYIVCPFKKISMFGPFFLSLGFFSFLIFFESHPLLLCFYLFIN